MILVTHNFFLVAIVLSGILLFFHGAEPDGKECIIRGMSEKNGRGNKEFYEDRGED